MTTRTGAVVFGAVDGLALVIGLVLGLAVSGQPYASVWHAGLSGGVAEFGGMTLGAYWSDSDRDKLAALCNGAASAAAVIGCAAPFAVASGDVAVWASGVAIAGCGLVITWLRAERGWVAAARTFGLLALAGALSAAANMI